MGFGYHNHTTWAVRGPHGVVAVARKSHSLLTATWKMSFVEAQLKRATLPAPKGAMVQITKTKTNKASKTQTNTACSPQQNFGLAYYRENDCPYRELTLAPQCNLVHKLGSGLNGTLAKRWGKFGALFEHKMHIAKESQHMGFVPDLCVRFEAEPGFEGGYMRLSCDESGFGVMVSDDAHCRKGRHWFRMHFTSHDNCFS